MNSRSLRLSDVLATLGGLRRHSLLQILFGITFGALAALSVAPQAADQPVRIEIGDLPPEVGQWEPGWIELRFHNETVEPVQVNLGPKRKANTAISVSRQGSELPAVPLQLSGFGPSYEVEVQPGAVFTSKILLNERYPTLLAGSYVLNVGFLGSAKLGGRTWTISAERRFEVRIAAADRYRLAGLCADLARQVAEAETAEQT